MSAAQAWSKFLSHSLATRLNPENFESYAQLLSSKHPLSPNHVSDLFLRPSTTNDGSLDPRTPRYMQVLLGLELVNIPAILRALRKYSTFGTVLEEQDIGGHSKEVEVDGEEHGRKDGERRKRWTNSYAAEETIFYQAARYVTSGSTPKDIQETIDLILAITKWLDLVAPAGHKANEMLNLGQTQAQEMTATTIALGTLMVAIVDNGRVVQALSKRSCPKGTVAQLSKALGDFVPLLMQSHPPTAERLALFRSQTLVAIEPPEKEVTASNAIDNILDEGLNLGMDSIVVADVPNMNSRAGLYIYLNSLLVARPLIDDHAIFAYLQNRYQGDIQSTAIDLILASFDILANAKLHHESAQTTTLLRSFLINKVPLLLTTLSASFFPPLTSEYCITAALDRVDTNAFPTLSTLFDESSSNDMFSDSVRQDFCFACCVHGLVEETSIEALLGDIPMQSLPADGRYVKEHLVQQCLSDPEKTEGMIDKLDHMDGNVGAVSQAITEVIGRLCNNRETVFLKTICSLLARKSSSLDIMVLFDKPITILQPISDLLDNWHYDEDQVEYQPVYEEFGSVILLLLSFVHRYNLTTADLGIRSSTSFVARLLDKGHLSRAMETLTEQEQNHLDGWIRGLFDNESGGLGDELMSSCPPQDFHLLVPTLFHHIVVACSTNNISEESFKGGLELFVEPFLLPSLIPAITWLSSHLWESRGDANAVLQILSALITNPASISNNIEASQMLNLIISITAKSLEHSLRWLQRAEPQRQDVEPLSKALRSNLGWERRGGSEHIELESWTSTGLTGSIRNTISGLVQWGVNPEVNINPAYYTHRQILVGLKLLGAKRLLNTILDEVKAHEEAGNGPAVLDVATALVCAPDAMSWDPTPGIGILGDGISVTPLQRRMTLREALKIEADNAPKLHKTDAPLAETAIRLHRRVEAQMAVHQQSFLPHDAISNLDVALNGAIGAALNDMAGGIPDGEQSIDDVMMAQTDLMSGYIAETNGMDEDLYGGMGDGIRY